MQLEEIEDGLTHITCNVLCADRVTQMTKAYNDIGAVTRLLEEKERDLELAARIGQTLLEKNRAYEEKNEQLEELLTQANERISQLKHELAMKDELIRVYTQNYEGLEASTPSGSEGEGQDGVSVPFLQRKVKSLEEENLTLHLETSKLKSVTEGLEEKEQKLVNDCVQQLEESHQQLAQFAKELSEKSDECCTQKEEITNLLHQIVTLQKKLRIATVENLDYQKTLEAAHDSQNYLTREIAELKEKNEELLVLLDENQEELRRLRSRERPSAVRHNYMSSFMSVPSDSLASELENSLRNEIDYPRGYSPMERNRHNWKIFETAKAAKQATRGGAGSTLGAASSLDVSLLGTSGIESADSRSVSQRSSMYFSDGESGVSEGFGADTESLYGGSGSTLKPGRPGVPGSNDLQTSLRRLSLRRANELNEMDYAREERERQTRERTLSELTDHSDVEPITPGRCRTPDSVMSGNSGYMSMTGSSGNPYFRMPEKLRIVKPLEGSVTLRQWQQLATPNLGRIFESRPGVQIKGEKNLDLEAEVYTLSDYEEDDDIMDCPARFPESSGVYTFTNSTVRHPSEAGRVSSSLTSTPAMAVSVSARASGTSTYSMSLGLASILNERDLLKTPPEGSGASRALFPNVSGQHAGSMNAGKSNPSRFPSLVSDTHYNPTLSQTQTTCLTLPTNNYNIISSPSTWSERSERRGTGSFSTHSGMTTMSLNDSVPRSMMTTPASSTTTTGSGVGGAESSALSMINKLKSTGVTLYGLFNGTSAEIDNRPNVSRPNTLPVTVPSISMTSSTVSMATGEKDLSGLVTVGSVSSETERKSSLTSLFSRKTAGGVIGALAKLNRDGTL